MLNALGKQVEQVSSGYAEKFGLVRDANWFMLKLHEEVGELTSSYVEMAGGARPRGKTDEEIKTEFSDELADVLAHVILLAEHFDIDLDEAVKSKWLKWL